MNRTSAAVLLARVAILLESARLEAELCSADTAARHIKQAQELVGQVQENI